MRFFCLVSGPIWFFNGLLFVANASFNNLGFPLLSTLFNIDGVGREDSDEDGAEG